MNGLSLKIITARFEWNLGRSIQNQYTKSDGIGFYVRKLLIISARVAELADALDSGSYWISRTYEEPLGLERTL